MPNQDDDRLSANTCQHYELIVLWKCVNMHCTCQVTTEGIWDVTTVCAVIREMRTQKGLFLNDEKVLDFA
jgi:phage protein D